MLNEFVLISLKDPFNWLIIIGSISAFFIADCICISIEKDGQAK
jgi:hypothetical protein